MNGVRGISAFIALTLTLVMASFAHASTFTLDFGGKLTSVTGTNSLGGSVGQDVSGSIAVTEIHGPFDTSDPTQVSTTYWSADTIWTFSLGVGGGGLTTLTSFTRYFPPTANFGFNFSQDGRIAGLQGEWLDVTFLANGADPLIPPPTLTSIPSTLAGWSAYFAVAIASSGTLQYDGSTYDFAVSEATITATPLPPSLVLMITALSGLGIAAWRRRLPSRA
jgi:hypothetical protein